MKSTSEITINSPISDIKGFGPKKCEKLQKLGLNTLADTLSFYPRSYNDLRNVVNICDAKNGEQLLIIGKVLLVNFGFGYGRKKTLHLLIEDKTGRAEVLFFMAGYMKNAFTVGEDYFFFGKVKVENGRVSIFHPEFGKYSENNGSIVPVYPLTKGISQKDIRNLTELAVSKSRELSETLPDKVIQNCNLCSNSFAYSNIHFPENVEMYKSAKYRLVFEEFFDLKTALLLSKGDCNNNKGEPHKSDKANEFIASLPYALTNAQNRVIEDILSDIRSSKPMNRLVQGDVGSGKTVVAMAALFEVVFAGFQGLLMAPTDILARQHFDTLNKAFTPFGINVVLLTSSMSTTEKKAVLADLKNGKAQIAVGTHALISESVEYNNVGLVITDEQHRFGVFQRQKLSKKGSNPDVLVMTATPIPRTLAVILYAGMDVSIIDELPPGRKPIQTFKYEESQRIDAYKLLFSELDKGRQAYIVAPFIEDSESINGRSATRLYEAFVKKHPEITCGLLHGDLNKEEKDSIMNSFKNGEIKVLISTVVIEVGIDVPNASIMLIENSERFGLAQMHQLRGRVGRGQYESYCLLCIQESNEIAESRAEILCSSSDGFEIAEKDMEIRGPGDILGYRQHGLPELVLANPIKHMAILEAANNAAETIIKDDPNLDKPENYCILTKLKEKYNKLDMLTI